MTHHDAGSLIASLVEMAKATERLPQVENDLDNALKTINHLNDTVQRLEIKLIDRNNTINDLGVTIHKLEVARDDAELRFLECDDAKSTLERTLEGLGKDITSVLAAIAPMPTPEPVAVVEPTSKEILNQTLEVTSIIFPFDESTSPPDVSSDGVATGQSEADPTVAGVEHSQHVIVQSEPAVLQESVASTEGVSVPSDPTATPTPTSESEIVGIAKQAATANTTKSTSPKVYWPSTHQ
jgi:hypothetical protein